MKCYDKNKFQLQLVYHIISPLADTGHMYSNQTSESLTKVWWLTNVDHSNHWKALGIEESLKSKDTNSNILCLDIGSLVGIEMILRKQQQSSSCICNIFFSTAKKWCNPFFLPCSAVCGLPCLPALAEFEVVAAASCAEKLGPETTSERKSWKCEAC